MNLHFDCREAIWKVGPGLVIMTNPTLDVKHMKRAPLATQSAAEIDGVYGKVPTVPLLERVSFLVHRVNAQMLRVCNPHFLKWGVDLVTSRMMVALLESDALTAGEIVKLMALPQSTISHQLKRLEKLGYITRESSQGDSRIVIAKLTEQGRQIADEANRLSRQVVSRMLESIPQEDARLIRAGLKEMDRALESMR